MRKVTTFEENRKSAARQAGRSDDVDDPMEDVEEGEFESADSENREVEDDESEDELVEREMMMMMTAILLVNQPTLNHNKCPATNLMKKELIAMESSITLYVPLQRCVVTFVRASQGINLSLSLIKSCASDLLVEIRQHSKLNIKELLESSRA